MTEPSRESERLFKALVDLPPAERETRLTAAPPDVRAEVESMIAAHEEMPTGFLDSSASPAKQIASPDGPDPLIGRRVGAYEVKRLIGAGGMGRVYLGVHAQLGRKVALKIMRPGATSASAFQRFELEARVLAKLKHVGIAQLHEIGSADLGMGEVPYFAMEYVQNARIITEHAEATNMSLRDRLRLFVVVCDAVFHGNQKGVVHRDLKPGNILVDSEGQAKIIDFGVAKATDSDKSALSIQLGFAQLAGTLQYMSPEQFNEDSDDIDGRSDVYALGLVLYELMCGQLPYTVSASAVHEAARVVRETPPTAPSSINKWLKGDLETIMLKALAKEREQRYRTAADLADDVSHFLNDEPIEARPPSIGYHLRMMALRRKGLFAGAAAVAAALVLGFISTALALAAEQKARDRADHEAEIANRYNQFLNNDVLAPLCNPDDQPDPGFRTAVKLVLDQATEHAEDAFINDPRHKAAVSLALGYSYQAIGYPDAAEPLLKRALRLYEHELGSGHVKSVRALRLLGRVHTEQNRLDEAATELSLAMERGRLALGETHIETVLAMAELGLVYSYSGREKEGAALREDAARLRRMSRQGDELTTLTGSAGSEQELKAKADIAAMLQRAGDLEGARRLHDELVTEHLRTFGPRHPATFRVMNNFAAWHLRRAAEHQRANDEPSSLAALSEALLLYEQFVEAARAYYGGHDARLGSYLNGHGSTLTQLGRYEEAEPRLLEAHELNECIVGPDDRRTISSVRWLVELYQNWHKPDEADRWSALLPD